jgi:hypothetical protein
MNTSSLSPIRVLRDLQQHTTTETLTSALHDLCSHFGRVEKLSVLTAKNEGIKQAICFLRLGTVHQEQSLMKTLGVGRFGGEIVIVVDLKSQRVQTETSHNFNWKLDYNTPAVALRAHG